MFHRCDDEGSKRSRFHSLLNDAQAMFTAFFFADYFPSIGWLDKLTGQYSRLEKTFKDLDVFYEEIINDHLDPNRPTSQQGDIIDVLLHLRKQRTFTFELTIDHIKALLLVNIPFFIFFTKYSLKTYSMGDLAWSERRWG